jgi:hypothetical protein
MQGRRCRRWRNNYRRPNMRWSYDYEWVVMIIVKLMSWFYFGVGYQIIVWCLLLVGGLVVWTLLWWVAMRCRLIMPIWFNLFQIDSSILTIWNSYAAKDWHRALTDKLVCTPLWTDVSIIMNRNVWPYLLSVADMYQVKRLKLHYASKMWDMASEETVTSFLR